MGVRILRRECGAAAGIATCSAKGVSARDSIPLKSVRTSRVRNGAKIGSTWYAPATGWRLEFECRRRLQVSSAPFPLDATPLEGEHKDARRCGGAYPMGAIVLIGIGVAFLFGEVIGGDAFPALVLIAMGTAFLLRDRWPR